MIQNFEDRQNGLEKAIGWEKSSYKIQQVPIQGIEIIGQ